jgi:hypothetical protein
LDRHPRRLGPTDRKAVAAEFEFERIAEWSPTRHTHAGARRETHLQKPDGERVVSLDSDHEANLSDGEAVELSARRTTTMALWLTNRGGSTEIRSHFNSPGV